MFKDGMKITGWYVWIFIVIVVLGLVWHFGWLKFGKQASLDLERKAIKHSIQYTETIKAELFTLKNNYDLVCTRIAEYTAADPINYAKVIESLEIQKSSLANQINRRAAGLEPDALPPELRQLRN